MNPRPGFENMVRAYAAELFRYAYWISRNRSVAEDLVQETFTRAWGSWGDLQDDKAVKGWLYTILRHEHARMFERKRLDMVDVELDNLVAPQEIGQDDRIDLRAALEKLPEGYREPLLLQVLGGFSCTEIAGMLDTTEGAIMTRLSRARLALRAQEIPAVNRRISG